MSNKRKISIFLIYSDPNKKIIYFLKQACPQTARGDAFAKAPPRTPPQNLQRAQSRRGARRACFAPRRPSAAQDI